MAVEPAPPTVEPLSEAPAPRKPAPKSYQPLTTRLVPRPGTFLVFLFGLWVKRITRRVRVPEWVKWWLLVLATANWRSAPGSVRPACFCLERVELMLEPRGSRYWSATVTSVIPAAWARFLIKGRAAVLKNVVGKSPFGAVSYTEHIASFNFCASVSVSLLLSRPRADVDDSALKVTLYCTFRTRLVRAFDDQSRRVLRFRCEQMRTRSIERDYDGTSTTSERLCVETLNTCDGPSPRHRHLEQALFADLHFGRRKDGRGDSVHILQRGALFDLTRVAIRLFVCFGTGTNACDLSR